MILEKLKGIITEHMGVDESDISENTNFRENINCDDIDIIEIILAVEDEFDIDIPDEDIVNITTVGELADFVQANN